MQDGDKWGRASGSECPRTEEMSLLYVPPHVANAAST